MLRGTGLIRRPVRLVVPGEGAGDPRDRPEPAAARWVAPDGARRPHTVTGRPSERSLRAHMRRPWHVPCRLFALVCRMSQPQPLARVHTTGFAEARAPLMPTRLRRSGDRQFPQLWRRGSRHREVWGRYTRTRYGGATRANGSSARPKGQAGSGRARNWRIRAAGRDWQCGIRPARGWPRGPAAAIRTRATWANRASRESRRRLLCLKRRRVPGPCTAVEASVITRYVGAPSAPLARHV